MFKAQASRQPPEVGAGGHSHRRYLWLQTIPGFCHFLIVFLTPTFLQLPIFFPYPTDTSPILFFFFFFLTFHLVNKTQNNRMRIKYFFTHCFLISKISLDGIVTCSMNLALEVSLMNMAEKVEWDFLQCSSSSRGTKTKYVFPLEIVKDSMSS